MPSRIQIAAGIDAGSSRTRSVLCAIEGDRIRYLSHGLATSSGWHKGRVVDQMAVAESMRAAMTDAEHGAGCAAESVTLGIGGMHVHGAQSRGMYEFGRPLKCRQRP